MYTVNSIQSRKVRSDYKYSLDIHADTIAARCEQDLGLWLKK